MKVLVTGGTGFIGRNLVSRLVNDGHKTSCLVRKSSDSESLMKHGVELCIGDITTEFILPDCDAVVHLAGNLGSAGVNLTGTKNLLKKCSGQKFIYLSSAGVLGPVINADERAPLNPTNDYEKSKADAEKLVQQYDNHVVLRPEFVYGPHDMHVLQLFKAINDHRFFVLGRGASLLHPTYVDDIVECIVRSLDVKNETFNIAGDRAVPVNELRDLIAAQLRVRPSRFRIPMVVAKTFVRLSPYMSNPVLTQSRLDFFTKSRSFDTRKAQRMLCYKPVKLENGLWHTIDWYKKEGLL